MKYARHIHVLHLLASIPRREAIPDAPSWLVQRTAISTPGEAIQAWDHLFTYIHKNWAVPTEEDRRYYYRAESTVPDSVKINLFDCKMALDMPAAEIEERLQQLPPFFTEFIFPVAVGRFMLRELALPFNHRKSTTFSEFHRRYGALILSC